MQMLERLQNALPEYSIQEITSKEYDDVYTLQKDNIHYSEYTKQEVTLESIIEEIQELPPHTKANQKKFIGFYQNQKLQAIMDYVDGYPNDEYYYIGLFMIDVHNQHQGIGTHIIQTFKKLTHRKIQLGCLSNNREGFAFWTKMGFKEIRISYNQEYNWEIKVLECLNS